MTSTSTAVFHGLSLTIVDHASQKWLTAEQVGLALGYNEANARQGILKLYRNHSDEFTDQDKGVVELATPGGMQPVTIFSLSGITMLGFFANTSRAKEFRQWAKQVLAEKAAPAAPVPAQAPVSATHRRLAPVRITRALERRLLEAFVTSDSSQHQLGRRFGISNTTTNLILYGKYQFSPLAGASQCSDALLDAVADKLFFNEQSRLLAYQQGMVGRLRCTANNQALADRLDLVGKVLQQVLLPATSSET